MPITDTSDLIDTIRQFALLSSGQCAQLTLLGTEITDVKDLADELIRRDWLTQFQSSLLLEGRGRELVLDQYVLLNLLGQGSMGKVYQARQSRLGRIVAVKVVREDVLVIPEAVERFRREAHAAGKLSHPNVVTVFDTNQVGDAHFLVMEYIEGSDLAALIKAHGALPVGQGCDYIRQAALGLQHVHEQGLIHRDIKPGNLMLDGQGTVKLMDMGLARFASEGSSWSSLTNTGEILGTVGYMAPEQIRDAKHVDIRADIYGLGCSLYHLLTGTLPFTGSISEITRKHRQGDVTPVHVVRPEVSPAVSAIVQKMMANKREDRYQVPIEAATALESFANRSEKTPSAPAEPANKPGSTAPAEANTMPFPPR